MQPAYEFLTVFKGKNAITYLAEDFLENGENATPYKIIQNPSENIPFVKFTLNEADGVHMFDGVKYD